MAIVWISLVLSAAHGALRLADYAADHRGGRRRRLLLLRATFGWSAGSNAFIAQLEPAMRLMAGGLRVGLGVAAGAGERDRGAARSGALRVSPRRSGKRTRRKHLRRDRFDGRPHAKPRIRDDRASLSRAIGDGRRPRAGFSTSWPRRLRTAGKCSVRFGADRRREDERLGADAHSGRARRVYRRARSRIWRTRSGTR